jgi:hypothetical protein
MQASANHAGVIYFMKLAWGAVRECDLCQRQTTVRPYGTRERSDRDRSGAGCVPSLCVSAAVSYLCCQSAGAWSAASEL